MSARQVQSELDELVAAARTGAPAPLRPLDARRLVRAAVDRGLARRKTRRVSMVWALAATLLLGFVSAAHLLLGHGPTVVQVGAGDRPLRLALRSGDSLVAAPATELEIVAQEARSRSVNVTHGTALFDVRPLRAGERFEIHTVHADMRVLGTVFAVEVASGRTIVRVYEGRVFVSGSVVQAGGVWVSSGAPPARNGEALAEEAAAAVDARTRAADVAGLRVASEVQLPAVTVVPLAQPDGQVGVALPASKSGQVEPLRADDVRALLNAGDGERALALAESQISTGQAAWLLLLADALQTLGRFETASLRYEQAARAFAEGAEREQAALSAASLAVHREQDGPRTLALLDAFALDADRSSVRERGSVLRVEALLLMGQREAARVHALRYLDREPYTQTSARMRSLLQ